MEKEKAKLTENLAFPETDLTLVVEGQKIHVNKSVLSEHSPVFDTMFKSQFKESTAKEIQLEDKKAEDVVEFLSCFYPKMKHPVTGTYDYICTLNPYIFIVREKSVYTSEKQNNQSN